MKNTALFIIGFLTFSTIATAQSDQNDICRFEEILGETKTNALNLLVADFENYLKEEYRNMTVENAYQEFLKDMKDGSFDWDSFYFQTEETKKEFVKSGLKRDLYKTDPDSGLTVNRLGNYMKALYQIKDNSDQLIKEYYEAREAVGLVQNELFASIVLANDPDFTNYFHKRFVVVEFSY